MKKALLVALSTMSLTAAAAEGPTFYGMANKELRNVSQKSKYNYGKTGNVQDVESKESRLGVKASYGEEWKGTAVLELGLNSSSKGTGSNAALNERIRMRVAKVDLDSFLGTLSLGQDYTASSYAAMAIDPLSYTSANWMGSDQALTVANGASNIGFYYRGLKDRLGYTTPTFGGVKLQLTWDRNNDPDLTTNPRPVNMLESLLSYNGEFNDVKLDLFLGYNAAMKEYLESATTNIKDENSVLWGGKLGYMGATLGLYYQHHELKSVALASNTETKKKQDWMDVALSYTHDKHTFAFSYANHTNNRGGALGKIVYQQYAVGYNHKCNDHLTLRLTGWNYDVNDKQDASKKNSANVLALGATLGF